jgi:hypothetical protein
MKTTFDRLGGNYLVNTIHDINNSGPVKTGGFLFRLLFGPTLGAFRLFALDLPAHLLLKGLRTVNTITYESMKYRGVLDEIYVDPIYEAINQSLNNATSGFIKSFIAGPYIETAVAIKQGVESWQSKNFGTTKIEDLEFSRENLAAKTEETKKSYIAKEIAKMNDKRDLFRQEVGSLNAKLAEFEPLSEAERRAKLAGETAAKNSNPQLSETTSAISSSAAKIPSAPNPPESTTGSLKPPITASSLQKGALQKESGGAALG